MQSVRNPDGERGVLVVPVLPGTVLRSVALAREHEPASQRVLPVAAALAGSLTLIAVAVVFVSRGSGTKHAVTTPATTVSEPLPATPQHVAVHAPLPAPATTSTPEDSAARRALASARKLAAQLPVALDSSALLRSGSTVYVLGGTSRTGAPSDGIWQIDLPSRRVIAAGQFIEPLTDSAAASLDGELYLAGGWTGDKLATGVLRWSPGHSSSLVTRLPNGMRGAHAAFVGRTLYVVSGDGSKAFAVDVDAGTISSVGKVPGAAGKRRSNLAELADALRAQQ